MDCRFWNPRLGTRVNLSHQMCACLSAKAGTHSHESQLVCAAVTHSSFQQRDPVVMGPCFRRDDEREGRVK